jgi:tetratricopeptide (TPR) repeat protein
MTGYSFKGAMAPRLRAIASTLAALPASPVFRTVAPLLILGLFYWALFQSPGSLRGASLTPEEARALLAQSKQLMRDQKYEEALGPVLKLYGAYPDNHIYVDQAAQIFHKLHRYKKEVDLWEEYRITAPRPEEACPHLGQAYEQLGLPQEAISAYEWCLSLQPDNGDSIFYLAHALEREGQFERAGELYRRGLASNPKYGDLAIGLARVLLRQNRSAEAKTLVSDVLQRQPENTDALYVIGTIYFREGDLTHARQYFEKGIMQSDDNVDFHLALARLAEKEDNVADAIVQYNRVVELDPEDKGVRAKRDALVAGRK